MDASLLVLIALLNSWCVLFIALQAFDCSNITALTFFLLIFANKKKIALMVVLATPTSFSHKLGKCYLVFCFSCSLTSINQSYTKKFMLHQQIYNGTFAKLNWKLDVPWFSHGSWNCKLVNFLIGYMDPPNCA